jgi:hypothetical protein
MRTFTAILATALLAAPALADPMPNLIPEHDVSGTSRVTGNVGPKTITVEYSKAVGVLRLTPPGGAGYLLYDFAAKDAKMVMPQMQRYMDQPSVADQAKQLQNAGNGNNVSIAKGATETIAGKDCTDYTATSKTKGTSSTLCVTDDGVLLKLASTDGSAVAQSISYNTVPEADVQVPAGYEQFVMPQMPPGMTMPPGAMSAMPPGAMPPGTMSAPPPGAMNGMQMPGSQNQ